MTQSFLPEIPLPALPKLDPEKGPHFIAGVASPLWLMFGGAAMAGATWWWWSARWREAVNVEALMAPKLALVPPPIRAAPMVEAAAPVPEPVVDPVTEAPVLAPVELAPEPQTPPLVTAAVEVVAEATEKTLDAAGAVVAEAQETVEAAAAPVVEAVTETAKSAADDLTLLVGIGPKLAASLADLGVTRFAQIADWGPEQLADFDVKLSLKGRAERDAWVSQAKRLANP